MNIAKKNISALQKNPFGGTVIEFIANRGNNEVIPYKISSNHGSDNDWKWIRDRLDFNKHTNFIVIGIGNGILIENIYQNMSILSTLTIIEKYNSVLMNVLGTKDISNILQDNRISIIASDKTNERNRLIKRRLVDEYFVFNTPNISIITCPYLKSFDEDFVNEIVYYISSQVFFNTHSFGNDINDVLEGFDHIIDNWENMMDGVGINNFKDAYKGIPAIIVSAGPSLDKNIELLKKAYKKALILTVDATAKKVIDLGIIPDTISSMERTNGVYGTFYKDLDIPDGTAFLGPPVITKQILNRFKKKVITGRNGEIITKATTQLLGYDSIEIGTSCSHIPFSFAKYVGADPIIFIGQDLAFAPDGRTHFQDVAKRAREGALEMDKKWVIGNNGEKLLTNVAYYRFLLWFENEIANTDGITFINATEGGARIKGTKIMRLSEAIDRYCYKDVVHLGERYDSFKEKHIFDNNVILQRTNIFFDNLIKSASEIQDFIISREKELNELRTEEINFNIFHNKINQLYRKLCLSNIIRFIVQPIYVSYYRGVHQYPVKMSENQWSKIIFETQSFYEKLFNIMEALKYKFENYKKSIKGDSN